MNNKKPGKIYNINIDNVYRVEFFKPNQFVNVYNMAIYEFDNMLYTLTLSVKEFTSIIIGVSQPNPVHFTTTFGDGIDIKSISEEKTSLTINKSISINMDKEQLIDLFVKIIQFKDK